MTKRPESLRLKIDPLKLNDEWEGHSEQVGQWAREHVRTMSALAEAEDHLELTKAEIEVEVREAPKEYGIEKVSNDVVTAVVRTQPEVKAAVDAVREARKHNNLAKAAMLSLEHRKRSLTKMTDLWTHEYYSSKGD